MRSLVLSLAASLVLCLSARADAPDARSVTFLHEWDVQLDSCVYWSDDPAIVVSHALAGASAAEYFDRNYVRRDAGNLVSYGASVRDGRTRGHVRARFNGDELTAFRFRLRGSPDVWRGRGAVRLRDVTSVRVVRD